MSHVSPFEVFSQTFPDVTESYRAIKRDYGAEGPLDEKTKQLVQVAIMAAIGSQSGTQAYAERALDAGATDDEVRQTVLLVLGPAGMSRTGSGIHWVNEVIEKRRSS